MGNPDCRYILPDAIKPVCWNDNERMNALMAPIRPRNVNPTDYDSKLKFWSEIIEAWCHHYKIVSFDMPIIRTCIQREGRTPACLQTVLDSLVRNGTVTYRDTFLESSPQSWKDWALNLVIKKPLNWGYSKFSAILAPKDPNAIIYVLVPVIKSLGTTLLNTIYKLHLEGKILAIDEVFKISELNSMEDVLLILHSLVQTNDVVVRYNPIASQLVKFRKKGQDGVSISEIDISVYNLKYNEKILSAHIQQLEEEKEAALNDAKKYLKSNMKQMAKISLRKKKELEKYIEKRTIALDNVCSLINRIHQAESDAKVLECYQIGVNSLKVVFKETGLNEQAVADTMDQVEEVLDIHNEMEATLARPYETNIEDELEKELDLILLEETPEVPPDAPSGGLPHNKVSSTNLDERLKLLSLSDLPEPPAFSLSKNSGLENVGITSE